MSDIAVLLFLHVQSTLQGAADSCRRWSVAAGAGRRQRLAAGDDRGQATTEYALVLLAAALVGLMVVAWATAGGGSARISRLFNGVIDAVIDRV
jgi:hypothetical protein